MRCLFTKATKPWQKVVCMSAGTLAGCGLLYGSMWSLRAAAELLPDHPGGRRIRTVVPGSKPTPGELCFQQTCLGLISVVAIPYLTKTYYDLLVDNIFTMRALFKETECCILARRAIFPVLTTPMWTCGFIAMTTLGPYWIYGIFGEAHANGKNWLREV